MAVNVDDIIKSLPADRRAKIAARSQEMIEETIAYATTLAQFRKAVGKTQAEVAKVLGINQNAVSQLENRSDTYVSTLRRFLKSLDMTLELSVVAKNGVRINLPHFLRDEDLPANDFAVLSRAMKTAISKKVSATKPASNVAKRKSAPSRKREVA
jgi:transcriptional regulator with XRE-family HTH domain